MVYSGAHFISLHQWTMDGHISHINYPCCRWTALWQAFQANASCIDVGANPCQTIGQSLAVIPSGFPYALIQCFTHGISYNVVLDTAGIIKDMSTRIKNGQRFHNMSEVLEIVAVKYSHNDMDYMA